MIDDSCNLVLTLLKTLLDLNNMSVLEYLAWMSEQLYTYTQIFGYSK